MTADLILRGGRVIDHARLVDEVTDVAFRDGRVVNEPAGPETEIRDVSGKIVAPGLIDLHTHVYWGGTSLGVDPDDYGRQAGVTTAVDTGSAGPGNFAGFRNHVIEKSDVRVLAYLHVSFAGIYAFGREVMVGESQDMRLMAPREAARVADENRDVVIGIKVRLGRNASGTQGMNPFEYALQVAEETGLPMMVHIDEPPPSYEEVVSRLRQGDVLTHCFRPFPNAPVTPQGTVRRAVLDARERGVLFDVGHGKGSFAFKTARAMLANGFLPDTISSDVHQLCIDGPAYDQLVTMSKFLCLGVDIAKIVELSTENAAMAVRRPELGTLAPGAVGDATILDIETGSFDYTDVVGEVMTGDRRIVSNGIVLGGRWWHPT